MLKLVVSAPGGRKAELECEPTATFGDVKARIEQVLGVPPDKQKLLCNGKERKNAAETLASAGVTGKSKLMLMLVGGFQMPPAPAPAATASSGSVEEVTSSTAVAMEVEEQESGEAIDLEGEMPLPEGAQLPTDGSGGVVHVRQGRNRYHVKVPQGLSSSTFGELADYLVKSLLFPPGLPSHELRIIAKGKTAERSQALADGAVRDATVMLLFQEGFHLAEEGANWLRDQTSDLAEAEALITKLGKQIEANFSNEETALQLVKAFDVIGNLKYNVGIVRVREAALPEMARFRDRVLKADDRLQELKKRVR